YSRRTDLPGWKLIPRAEPTRSHAPRAPRQRSPAGVPNTRRIGLAPRTSGSAELCLANGRPRAAIQPNSYLECSQLVLSYKFAGIYNNTVIAGSASRIHFLLARLPHALDNLFAEHLHIIICLGQPPALHPRAA